MEKFRPALRDRRGEPTLAGRKISELIRIDSVLTKQADPAIPFAMSEQYTEQCIERRHQLLQELGVPKQRKARLTRLQKMREALTQAEMPYWKLLN